MGGTHANNRSNTVVTYPKIVPEAHKITVWCESITGKPKDMTRSATAYGSHALDIAEEIIGNERVLFSYISMALLDTGYPIIYTRTHWVYLYSFNTQYVFQNVLAPLRVVAIPIESDSGREYYETTSTWQNIRYTAANLTPEKLNRVDFVQERINAVYGWIAETDNWRIFVNRYVYQDYEVRPLPLPNG
jgi:hypothetical protein